MHDNEIIQDSATDSPVDGSLTSAVPTITIHPPSDFGDTEPEDDTQYPDHPPHYAPFAVDHLWYHDFDFSQRKPPPTRTQKLVRTIKSIARRRSTPIMSPQAIEQGGSSNTPTTENAFVHRVNNMLSPIVEEDRKQSTKRELKPGDFIFDEPMSIDEAAMLAVSPQPFNMEPDKLPTTNKKALEARLNFHLSELDYLKKQINFHNDNIFQTAHRAEMLAGRATPDDIQSTAIMRELGNALRVLRNVAKPFVEYHRKEIDRIAEIRVQMNVAAGLGPKMPQIFKNLPNDYEWAEMFLP